MILPFHSLAHFLVSFSFFVVLSVLLFPVVFPALHTMNLFRSLSLFPPFFGLSVSLSVLIPVLGVTRALQTGSSVVRRPGCTRSGTMSWPTPCPSSKP